MLYLDPSDYIAGLSVHNNVINIYEIISNSICEKSLPRLTDNGSYPVYIHGPDGKRLRDESGIRN